MNEPNSNHILRSITRFRRLAIGSAIFIAILSVAMIFRITSVLDANTAAKISLTGKQRLLSQRIVTDTISIDHAIQMGHWEDLEPLLLDLQRATNEIQAAHIALIKDIPAVKFSQDQAKAKQEAFVAIELPYQTIIRSTTELNKLTISIIRRSPYIDQLTRDRVTAAKDDIVMAQSIYLPGMETIVHLDEKKYESEIAQSIKYAKIGMFVLFTILVACILFIVEPTILIIRRQLKDLEKATNQAARADAVRWRLLSNMGHEFRTPMNAIMGFADLLSEQSLTESEHRRLTTSIYDSSTQLTHLIETMLDMSAIESGQLRIVKDSCNLRQLLDKLRTDTTTLAQSKKLKLNLHLDQSCPSQIITDTKRLEQIIYNLIDNAIKFTDIGQIDITASLLDTTEPKMLEIKVTDTGIGIKPEDQLSIFEPFIQSDDNVTRSFGGAGLGLTVSRDLARALGGDVAVESIPNQGSTFTLTINPGKVEHTQLPPDTEDTQSSSISLESNKILIVDDSKDNRVLIEHILKRTGATLEFAHDGQKAIVAVYAAIESKAPYDLILMDMQMPILDGYHATVELREEGINIPIIALTAHALDGDREHCLDAGCDEYMTKPLNKIHLIESCARLISKHAQINTRDQAA